MISIPWVFAIISFTMVITIMVTIILLSSIYKVMIIEPLKSKIEHEEDANPENCFYRKKQYLLTKNEYEFYKRLKAAVKNKGYVVCPKVRLADIIEAERGRDWRTAFNGIKSKHIDFLLCEGALSPILAIELDDNSHDKEDRKKRDDFVDQALSTAKIPVLRVRGAADLEVKIHDILDVPATVR